MKQAISNTMQRRARSRHTIGNGLMAGATLGLLIACAGDLPDQRESAQFLVCDDAEGPDREQYHLEKLNLELARDAQVRQLAGVDVVETCEQARTVREVQDSLAVETTDDEERATALDADEAEAEAEPELLAKVWQGVTTTRPHHVFLNTLSCSGVFISPNTILTAAHCIPDNSVTRGDSGQVRPLHYTPAYNGTTTSVSDARMWLHSAYSGSGDGNSDLGMIRLLSTSHSGRGMPIYAGDLELEELDLAGYGVTASCGTSSGILKEDPDGDGIVIDARMTHQINSVANHGVARTCSGDSGAPLVKRVTNGATYDTVVAVHSNSEKEGSCDDRCAKYKGKQEHTRLRSKLEWIEARLGLECISFASGLYYRCG